MLKRLSEEDFAVLRGSLESGRQSPSSLGFALILFIFFQPLIFFLTYIVAADSTIFPYEGGLFTLHLIITSALVLLSIVYAVPKIYMKGQKIQYLLITLVSQNTGGVCFYLSALFLIGADRMISQKSLLIFTCITLLFGLLVFTVTCIRFYILLGKGEYRKGSKKDKLRSKAEYDIKSFVPIIIVGSDCR